MKKTLLLLAAILVTSHAVTARNYYANYDIILCEVEAPDGISGTLERTDEGIFIYEDSLILAALDVRDLKSFRLSLTNRARHTIRIQWDEASYVNISGMAERVTHSGVPYAEKDNAQPPTTVPRRATISEVIIPSSNIFYAAKQWFIHFLFNVHYESLSELQEKAPLYVGKEMSLLLPLEINGELKDYMFIFKVEKFTGEQ